MKTRRTTRRELKREMETLTAENAELKKRLTVAEEKTLQFEIQPSPSLACEENRVTPIISGGYPTKATKLEAHTLKEAKALAMEYLSRW